MMKLLFYSSPLIRFLKYAIYPISPNANVHPTPATSSVGHSSSHDLHFQFLPLSQLFLVNRSIYEYKYG